MKLIALFFCFLDQATILRPIPGDHQQYLPDQSDLPMCHQVLQVSSRIFLFRLCQIVFTEKILSRRIFFREINFQKIIDFTNFLFLKFNLPSTYSRFSRLSSTAILRATASIKPFSTTQCSATAAARCLFKFIRSK